MKFAVVAAALVATVAAQDCIDSLPYTFEISPVNATTSTKRDLLEKRVAECTKTPIVTLQNGKLTDQQQRTGEIVSNYQFQFDSPVQPGNKATGGFCVNQNNQTLSIFGSAVFYSCISGDFSNLYTQDIGSVCSQVFLQAVQCVGGASSGSSSLSAGTASSTPATSATSAASTPATTPASTPATTLATTPATTPSAPAAPYPVGNSTTPAGSASAPASGSPTTTAGTSSTSPATFQPSSGANVLALGSQLIAGVAALGAFALF